MEAAISSEMYRNPPVISFALVVGWEVPMYDVSSAFACAKQADVPVLGPDMVPFLFNITIYTRIYII
jgi:hypothetical protein